MGCRLKLQASPEGRCKDGACQRTPGAGDLWRKRQLLRHSIIPKALQGIERIPIPGMALKGRGGRPIRLWFPMQLPLQLLKREVRQQRSQSELIGDPGSREDI